MKRSLKILLFAGIFAALVPLRTEAADSSNVIIEGTPDVSIDTIGPGENGKVNVAVSPNEDAGIVDVELNGESIVGGVELEPGKYTIYGVDKDGNKHEYTMNVEQSSDANSFSTEYREEWNTEWSTEWGDKGFEYKTETPVIECTPRDTEEPFEEEDDETTEKTSEDSKEDVLDKLPQTGGLDGRMTTVGGGILLFLGGIMIFAVGRNGKKEKEDN